jgi:hypothetical protein
MGWVCGTHGGVEKFIQNFVQKNLKGRSKLGACELISSGSG